VSSFATSRTLRVGLFLTVLLLIPVSFLLSRTLTSGYQQPTMAEFKEFHVVPDVIPTWPNNVAAVHYDTQAIVHLGNVLSTTHTQKLPRVSFPAEPHQYYTVMMLDPDAPSPESPTYRHWLHYIVVNVPGSGTHTDHADLHKGNIVTPYMGPAPPLNTGNHRYVWLIYKQKDKIDTISIEGPTTAATRGSFDHNQWMMKTFKYQPELHAGNFFKAHNEKNKH